MADDAGIVTEEPTVRFARRSSRGLLLGFSAPRVVAIGAGLGLGVVALALWGATGLIVAAPVWLTLVATAVVRVGGRPVAEWAGVAGEFSLRSATGQLEYRSRLPVRARPAGTLALAGDAAALRVHVDDATGAAMIHDPHRETLTAVLSVSHPAFVLLDRDDRAARVARWGRVFAALAQSDASVTLQVMEATVPDPATGEEEWYAANGVHDGSFADLRYRELLAQARLAAGAHRSTISLSLDLRSAARANRRSGRGLSGGAEVLRATMTALVDLARQAGLRVQGWLGEAELAALVRGAYDPASLLDPRRDPGANLTHAGPLALSERWDHLRHDSGYSSVLWVAEWPRIDVPVDFLHPLVFAPGIRRTLSIVARPVPTSTALRQIRREKTEAVSDMAQKRRVGQIADLADAREYEDLLARERSVVSGHADVEFAGFVVVTSPTLDALEAARDALRRAAAQAACELRPLYGRQAEGFALAALPLGRNAF